MIRILAVLLLAGTAWLATATPALAHAELIASSPAESATVSAPPTEVRLTFSEGLQASFTTVAVTGPDGAQWGIGQPTVVNTVVTVPVQPRGPAGPATITYRVLSADGHPVSGSIRFTLTSPAAASSGETTQPAPPTVTTTGAAGGDGVPVWVWIVGAVVLLAAGVVLALRVGRSAGS